MSVKRMALTGVAAAVTATMAFAGGASVHAADLPTYKAPVYEPVPVFSWSRCYIGVHVGGGWSSDPTTQIVPGDPNLAISQTLGNVPTGLSARRSGVLGGAQIGCDQQFDGFVLGIETDISGADIGGRTSVTQGPANVTTSFEHRLRAFGTLRGRLGVAHDRTLFYVTGGLAYGNIHARAAIDPPPALAALGAPVLAGSHSRWRVGWTVGGGIEHALDANWSVKAEYLYYDLGRSRLTAVTVAGAPNEIGYFDYRTRGHIVRAGINYRF